MANFPGSPQLVHGGFISIDPRSLKPPRIIRFQYNPETLSRTLVPGAGASAGIPTQLITFSLLLDATDQLEFPDQNPLAVRYGVYPLMSAIEALLYPPQSSGESLTLFVSGSNRILPVRLAQLQIVERMSDPSLNPIRVEIQVTLLVRTDADFPKGSPFRKYWDDYLSQLLGLADLTPNASLSDLGLTNPP